MRYQRSIEIEQRLDALLELIRSRKYSTPALAEKVGVSIPTISRSVEALRERGHNITAVEWTEVVDFPTPPLLFATAMMVMRTCIAHIRLSGKQNAQQVCQ